jgi:hypothetical protein
MNSHPYLRAYMAGIVVPTGLLLVATTIFLLSGLPIERAMIFPLAFVPNVWGAWNMLHIAMAKRLPIGIHGAILPVLLIPAGYAVARAFHLNFITAGGLMIFAPVAFIVYYLVWKHVVGFLNGLLGIAA